MRAGSPHKAHTYSAQDAATIIKTYDGQRAVIPNSDIYTNAVLVKTAYEKRRSQYDVGIGYGDNIEQACEVIRKAMAGVAEVESDPACEALPWELAASWITIRARWWTASRRADVVHVHAAVITAIKNALDDAHIDMPYQTQMLLVHDQTEATDGDRAAQREGWAVSPQGSSQPRWQTQQERQGQQKQQNQDESGASTSGQGNSHSHAAS